LKIFAVFVIAAEFFPTLKW